MVRGSDDELAAPTGGRAAPVDSDVVGGAADDDAATLAFQRLAGGSLAASFRLAVHLVGDRPDAEEVVQEALTLAWRAWPSLRDHHRFAAWFERILVNTAYERLRRRRRTPTALLPDELADRGADGIGAANDRDAIGRALLRLSPEHRVVVVLRYGRDLSIEDIAARLGVPSGTVRSRLHYALAELRLVMDPPLPRPEEARP